jgi:uncharacterized membrane protein (GlpM family)
MVGFGAFIGLASLLQWMSPNSLLTRPDDGGRALMYVMAFGTALVVLQMQIGHLTKKPFKIYGSIPFLLTNAYMALFLIGLKTGFRDALARWENPSYWCLALYMLVNSVWCFVRIVQ